jgi:hypothetical protein
MVLFTEASNKKFLYAERFIEYRYGSLFGTIYPGKTGSGEKE